MVRAAYKANTTHVKVKFLGSLPGESHSEAITPLGTWGIDMVKYSAGSNEAAGYGCDPRWLVTNPGEHTPDSEFRTKGDAVNYIAMRVNAVVNRTYDFGDSGRYAVVEVRGNGFGVRDVVTGENVMEGISSRYAARYQVQRMWAELIA